jgi:hypothetical protein
VFRVPFGILSKAGVTARVARGKTDERRDTKHASRHHHVIQRYLAYSRQPGTSTHRPDRQKRSLDGLTWLSVTVCDDAKRFVCRARGPNVTTRTLSPLMEYSRYLAQRGYEAQARMQRCGRAYLGRHDRTE